MTRRKTSSILKFTAALFIVLNFAPDVLAQTPVNIAQPSLALNYVVCIDGAIFPTQGSSPNQAYLGEVRAYAGSTIPTGWALADGATLSIDDNSALFALMENTYGGDGSTTFALPDLRGRAVIGTGSGAGLTPQSLGTTTGVQSVTLTAANLPSGSNTPFTLAQPSLALNYGIFRNGIFPSQGDGSGLDGSAMPGLISQMTLFAGYSNFLPGAAANGQLLPINQNQALFALLGVNYGGNGQTNFALPNLQGRTIVGTGQGAGLTSRTVGEFAGSETFALQPGNLPENGAAPFSLQQPYQSLNYLIGVNGDPVDVGTVTAFAGSTVPAGWLVADGRNLPVIDYGTLFALVGYTYGGSGSTFNLPDLRGRTIIGAGAAPGLTAWSLGETSGAEMAALIANNMPVPEPTSAALIFGSAAILVRRRRAASK